MTERQKEIALSLASALCIYPLEPASEMLKSREDFMLACSIYFHNRRALESVALALKNGIQYVSGSPKHYQEFLEAIRDPSIPKSAILEFERREEASRKPLVRIEKEVKTTRIYVMENRRNGYHKIGRSRNPVARERTLQAEDPQIEIVGNWPGTEADKDYLHDRFLDQRIRGEWFKLTVSDIGFIKSYFEKGKL